MVSSTLAEQIQKKRKPTLYEEIKRQSVEQPKIIQAIEESKKGGGSPPDVPPQIKYDYSNIPAGYTSTTGESIEYDIPTPSEDTGRRIQVYDTPPSDAKITEVGALIPATKEEKQRGGQLSPYMIVPPSSTIGAIEAGITGSIVSRGLTPPIQVGGYIPTQQRQEAEDVSSYTQQIIDIEQEFKKSPESFIDKEGVKVIETEKYKQIELTPEFYEKNIKPSEQLPTKFWSNAASFGIGYTKTFIGTGEAVLSIPFESSTQEFGKKTEIKAENIIKPFSKNLATGIVNIKTAPMGTTQIAGYTLPIGKYEALGSAAVIAPSLYLTGGGIFTAVRKEGLVSGLKQTARAFSFMKPTASTYVAEFKDIKAVSSTFKIGTQKINIKSGVDLTTGGRQSVISYEKFKNPKKILGNYEYITEQPAFRIDKAGNIIEDATFITKGRGRYKIPILEETPTINANGKKIELTKDISAFQSQESYLIKDNKILSRYSFPKREFIYSRGASLAETTGIKTKYASFGYDKKGNIKIQEKGLMYDLSNIGIDKTFYSNKGFKLSSLRPTTLLSSQTKTSLKDNVIITPQQPFNKFVKSPDLKLPLTRANLISFRETQISAEKQRVGNIYGTTPKLKYKETTRFRTAVTPIETTLTKQKPDFKFKVKLDTGLRTDLGQPTPELTKTILTTIPVTPTPIYPTIPTPTRTLTPTPPILPFPSLLFPESRTPRRRKGKRKYFRTPSLISLDIKLFAAKKSRYEELGLTARPIIR